MPIYEYRCSACGHQQEFLQKLSDPPQTRCTSCGKETFSKMVTAAGFQLKGSGWYATDFKSKPAKPATGTATAAKPAEGTASSADTGAKESAKESTKASESTSSSESSGGSSDASKGGASATTPAAS